MCANLYLYMKARPGDELKVEQGVKDLRSLSLPNMKQCGGQSAYILTPATDRPEHGSLGRRDSSVDLLVSTSCVYVCYATSSLYALAYYIVFIWATCSIMSVCVCKLP